MVKRVLKWYFGVSLVLRLLVCFIAGAVIGGVLWFLSERTGLAIGERAVEYVSPFGAIFVHMLKMVVIPVVFFSLISGAASLPISKFGRVGVKTIGWYLLCSLFAAIVGTVIALAVNPGEGANLAKWQAMAGEVTEKAAEVVGAVETEGALTKILFNLFRNPFEALAEGNFLPVIVFAIMFGLAIRVSIEKHGKGQQAERLGRLIELVEACRDAMIMAFTTRSSAATLPVSIKVAEDELGVHNELASFSLPLGATINMDGVCVHLPMFAVLAANLFGIDLTMGGLAILVITTVLASIGAGGVPGGSLMLLFVILETMGLSAEQVAIVVALALGINPILDMFETMNNVTGDIVCTYAVAHNEGLLDETG